MNCLRSVTLALMGCVAPFLAGAGSPGADASQPEQARLASTTLRVAGHRVRAEIADEETERMQGLMFRRSLGADEGMVFVFEQEMPLAFWMRNTLIPLDILYFDGGARLVSAEHRVPPCRTARCPVYPSRGPARFVLELNGGRAAELGIGPGSRLCEEPPRKTPLPPCE
ncbi:MAG: hypothetical protein KatS3mg126_1593 [Lysobacteraceae bacterium]|nr:MAG: hypothetical protein KatS3mg126_1593 [Xanthomonadaceae bacterium]